MVREPGNSVLSVKVVDDDDSELNNEPLKLVDQFIHLGSNISFTESNANVRLSKA